MSVLNPFFMDTSPPRDINIDNRKVISGVMAYEMTDYVGLMPKYSHENFGLYSSPEE